MQQEIRKWEAENGSVFTVFILLMLSDSLFEGRLCASMLWGSRVANIWRHCLCGASAELPAVCSLGRQNVGKEQLCQLPEVEELISATAKGHVEVRTIFLQGGLLKVLCVLHYGGERFIVCFSTVNTEERLIARCTWALPFCLALLIISMCFMETLRSFCVMSEATSTWAGKHLFKKQSALSQSASRDFNSMLSDVLPSGFGGPRQRQRSAKSPGARQQTPRRPWRLWKGELCRHTCH